MLLKPLGLCSKCDNRKTCVIATETNARVLECPDENRSDLRRSKDQSYQMIKKE